MIWLPALHTSRARLEGAFALLSQVSRRGSSPEEEFGAGDGADRVSSKADGIHRQFSQDCLGRGLMPGENTCDFQLARPGSGSVVVETASLAPNLPFCVSHQPSRVKQTLRPFHRHVTLVAIGVDILPAMNDRDSYGVPAGFAGSLGSSHHRLTSAEDYARGFSFGLSARRSFGREEHIACRRERQSLTPA